MMEQCTYKQEGQPAVHYTEKKYICEVSHTLELQNVKYLLQLFISMALQGQLSVFVT